jgi:hypothetical protein
VLGANATTLALLCSLRALDDGTITARVVPLAWTPRGVLLGESGQDLAVPLAGLFDWIDRTFPPEDELAFVAPLHDVELLARIGWDAPFPEPLRERSVLNLEDLPEELAEAFALPPAALAQCAACRRLCVRDDFVWKEKQLCAWDYHAQVFGKRGPWYQGAYAAHHFETLPSCAYVASDLLRDVRVEVVLTIGSLAPSASRAIVDAVLDGDREHAHMAVRTTTGLVLLREA